MLNAVTTTSRQVLSGHMMLIDGHACHHRNAAHRLGERFGMKLESECIDFGVFRFVCQHHASAKTLERFLRAQGYRVAHLSTPNSSCVVLVVELEKVPDNAVIIRTGWRAEWKA